MQYEKAGQGCQPGRVKWVDRLLDALLPGCCLLCGQACCGALSLCAGCRADLPRNRHACRHCALPLGSTTDRVCGACLSGPVMLDRVCAPLRYEFPLDRLVRRFKFQRNLAAGRVLADVLYRAWSPPAGAAPVWLVPVPMHWSRQFLRGFNQATELAWQLAQWGGHRLRTGALVRRRATRAQRGLDAAQRRHNLHRALAWRGRALAGDCVVLVDDVMTTGSTLHACARVLRQAGAGRVEAAVVARVLRED